MSLSRSRTVWADGRFLIGVALVVASMVGVWLVVSSARATNPVAVADHTLVPGQPLTPDNVRWVEVGLGPSISTYLTEIPDGFVVVSSVPAGELIPASAIIEAERSAVTTVVITSATDVASTLTVGSSVEVWMSPVTDRVYDDARVLIADATVAGLRQSKGIGATSGVTLELVISRSQVGAVLDAQASNAALWAVPLGGVR